MDASLRTGRTVNTNARESGMRIIISGMFPRPNYFEKDAALYRQGPCGLGRDQVQTEVSSFLDSKIIIRK